MMRALWDIINRDHPLRNSKDKEQCSAVAYRILGKFGGENRSSLREPARINWVKFSNPGCQLSVILSPEKRLDFVFDVLIEDAYKVIRTTHNEDAVTAAVDFLSNILTSFLPKEDEENNLESRIKFNLFHTKSDDSFRLQDQSSKFAGQAYMK